MWALLFLVAGAFASQSPDPSQFIVHEWGTHTAMQGSNGVGMAGLEHEEEALPSFVKSRATSLLENPDIHYNPANYPQPINVGKGGDWSTSTPDLQVTQKLETPVLYFYSPRSVNVQVDVKFTNGIVTEVYPNMTDFTPPLGQVNSVAGGGYAQWKVHVHGPTEDAPVPEVDPSSIWAPSRRVQANLLTHQHDYEATLSKAGLPLEQTESEHLIFYRGLGQWQGRLKVTSDSNTLSVHNTAAGTVSAVFLLETTEEGGAIRSLGDLRSGMSLTTNIEGEHLGDRILPMDLHVTRAQVMLEQALLQAGLFPLEARAMVETWTRSYFVSTGIRVLYVVPREWTDDILPIRITPTPDELERVLVGRVEVLPFDQEARLATSLATLAPDATHEDIEAVIGDDVRALGRFADSKFRRASEVANLQHLQPMLDSFLQDSIAEY